jgi:hypothetical protein
LHRYGIHVAAAWEIRGTGTGGRGYNRYTPVATVFDQARRGHGPKGQKRGGKMRREKQGILEDLMSVPWWISLILLIVVNAIIQVVIPVVLTARASGGPTGELLTVGYKGAKNSLSMMFSMALFFTMLISFVRQVITEKRWKKKMSVLPKSKICPNCKKKMNIKEKLSGEDKGKKFWVCTGYPECKTSIDSYSEDL